jgi:aspartyl-tRNA(Asn)/glutamyl-tRNA(Gln) amidotransferase subunit B
MRSALEAVAYAKTLHTLVQWIGICDGNMQEGSFRCDANVSVHQPGTPFGTRREIKNLNSFRFLEQAINFEVQWQIEQIESGNVIQQATVLFDPDTGETRMMRTKEDAHDYRYFPDPDLLPLEISETWKQQIAATLPELPHAKQARYQAQGLSAYDASLLTSSYAMADFFETAAQGADTKQCANWVINEVSAQLNREDRNIDTCPITPQQLGDIIKRIADGTLSNSAAKTVFRTLWVADEARAKQDGYVDYVIERDGLKQVSDSGAIEKIVDEILTANAEKVAEYRSGKDKLFGFFVGLAMKASKGQANPAQLNEVLRKRLTD